MRWVTLTALAGLLASGPLCQPRADTLPESALRDIANTADRICGIVATSGSSQALQAKGDVRAELNGLFKRFANVGGGISGQAASTSYQGVVQSELADTLKDMRDCKLKVFELLLSKLAPDTVPGEVPTGPEGTTPRQAQAASSLRRLVVTRDTELKRTPEQYAAVVEEIAAGQRVMVLSDFSSDAWTHVQDITNGVEGYISKSDLMRGP